MLPDHGDADGGDDDDEDADRGTTTITTTMMMALVMWVMFSLLPRVLIQALPSTAIAWFPPPQGEERRERHLPNDCNSAHSIRTEERRESPLSAPEATHLRLHA